MIEVPSLTVPTMKILEVPHGAQERVLPSKFTVSGSQVPYLSNDSVELSIS